MSIQSAIRVRKSKIVIVGAGPAGASLAIRLAMAGHAVTLVEKERFPREKLCGEFISPECFRHFAEIGVREEMFSRGGSRIAETRFFDAKGRSVGVPTKWFGHGDFALSLSRAEMDAALLERARRAGVEVFEGVRASAIEADGDQIVSLSLKNDRGERRDSGGDLFVDATGRAGALARMLEKGLGESDPRRSRLVAFKNHLTGVAVDPNVCEIYVFQGGYGGLSPVENGKANLCFIVQAGVAKEFIGKTNDHIRMVAARNARAGETLRDARPCGEWLAVPVGDFGRKIGPAVRNLISIGDAAAFIDPFTGSGMLMALQSAALLAECVEEFGVPSPILNSVYRQRHSAKFRKRLAASAVLRRAAFMPRLATAAILTTGLSDRVRERPARATRAGSSLSGDRA